jgi:AcrR family transcriptional regulator
MSSQALNEAEIQEDCLLDTKQRLLEAAMRVFSEKGFQGSSMRTITREAGTSLSAANYHFGSKEELLRSALAARAELLNARRIQLLEEASQGPRGGPELEAVLEAFIRPVFERQAEMMARGQVMSGLALRLYLDPHIVVSRIRHDVFEATNQRFAEALVQALPGSTEASALEALRFIPGVVVYAVSEGNEILQGNSTDGSDAKSRLERVVTFASAGVRALVGRASSSQKGAMS